MEPENAVRGILDTWSGDLFTKEKSGGYYSAPDIPEKKLRNAIGAYADGVDGARVLGLLDATVFGGAKDGCLFTDATLYWKPSARDVVVIPYRGLRDVSVDDGGDEEISMLYLDYHDKDTIVVTSKSYFDLDTLLAFFNEIRDANEKGLTSEVDGFVIVQDMSEHTRVSYMGTLAWLCYAGDSVVDAEEMMELQVLITQLKLQAGPRARVRDLVLGAADLDLDKLLEHLIASAPQGSREALGIALMRDAIRVHRSTSDASALDSDSLTLLAGKLSISADQVEVIEQACINDERILAGNISDEELVRQAKELAAQASAVGIPIAAVYLSGSVVGLSASGITSGLAALGLGGVLGLSSMVTGIGVAILLGVGAYKGLQWLTDGGKRERASRREFMLREVLRVHQTVISNLAEDIAVLAGEVVELAVQQNVRKAEVRQLGVKVQLLTNALSATKKREGAYQADLELERGLAADA